MLLTRQASFLFGYFMWLIDRFVCGALIDARRTVGLPLAFLLELHGWYVLSFMHRIFFTSDARGAGGISSPVLVDISL
jgi:hypothetical protein